MDLTPFEAQEILVVEGIRKRRRTNVNYRIQKQNCTAANNVLDGWIKNGVSQSKWDALVLVPSVQELLSVVNDSIEQENVDDVALSLHTTDAQKIPRNLQFSVESNETMTNLHEDKVSSSQSPELPDSEENSVTQMDPQQDARQDVIDHQMPIEEDEIDEIEQSSKPTLSLQRILQHFAAATGQKHTHLTMLLKLLKKFKPEPHYDSLPSTGEKLMTIDGNDFSRNGELPCLKLPPAIEIKGGKYFHFGLEAALNGESPGVFHFNNKDLFEYLEIHSKNPTLLPYRLRQKLDSMDDELQIQIAKLELKNKGSAAHLLTKQINALPHFVMDLSADGVQIANNSKIPSATPVCGRLYSVQPSFSSEIGIQYFARPEPFIIGFLHALKQDDASFLKTVIDELVRLSPFNNDENVTSGRSCTVTLRCVIADSPMRCFLKRTKYFTGNWSCDRCIQRGETVNGVLRFDDVNAPRRIDSEFLTYCKSRTSIDDHIPNPIDLSLFLDLEYLGMVSAFGIDSMHCVFCGAFLRRIVGFAGKSKRNEGQLGQPQLAKVNSRLERFKKCLLYEFDAHVGPLNTSKKYKCHVLRQFLYYTLFPAFQRILPTADLHHIMQLQHAMLLMGAYCPDKVSQVNIDKASVVLKDYATKLADRNIPCRFTSHQIIHLPDDVAKFGCGVECLSAFPFENFYSFFRRNVRSGNLVPEQLRNRLVERAKYLLPTTADGTVILNHKDLSRESAKRFGESYNKNRLVDFVDSNSSRAKKLIFLGYTLSNKFPNNVCLLSNNKPVVITDIIQYPPSSGNFKILGHTFKTVQDAFIEPFVSSQFNIYEASKLDCIVNEWNVPKIEGKMYPFTLNDSVPVDIFDDKQVWYLAPLRHTVQ